MRLIVSRLIITVIFISLLLALIGYARGYRLNLAQKTVTATGILVASSSPDGAKIYIDGQLKGATNSNISLKPGNYHVEIKKDGYSSWKKSMTIKSELVIKADALLFPQNPSLSPLTSLGVVKIESSPASDKIIIFSENDNAEKAGVYLLENTRKPLSIFNPLKLIALRSAFPQLDFKNTEVVFSPDSKQILLSFINQKNIIATYLLSTEEKNDQLFEITKSKDSVEQAWIKEKEKNNQKILETFKDPLPQIASDSFKIINFSPDESKILYQATKNTSLPLIIDPPLIGANQTPEERRLKKDNLYVYDKEEDKNFSIPASHLQLPTSVLWYPDSQHLVLNEGKQISIFDYDGENKQTVYSGPFIKDFVSVSADGKLLILANLNPQTNTLPDVYAVGIR